MTIDAKSFLGKFIRLPLKLIPPKAVLPIFTGEIKNAKWIVGSSTHGCWLGIYERRTQLYLSQLLSEGNTFFDIGANVGFFSLLAARKVGVKGQVYAFEPLPRNLKFLNEKCKN